MRCYNRVTLTWLIGERMAKERGVFEVREIEAAAQLVYGEMPPTPQHRWPLLEEALGCETWLKHENHTPTGAFKIRGGVTFIDWLKQSHPGTAGVVTATRGNHGQSQAFAATRAGLRCVVYVPKGNAVEKNAAMSAFGAEVIEFGDDFDEAREEAMQKGAREGFFPVPPFHRELVRGVATYGYELFKAAGSLDKVYVPIGCGSGICALIAVRDALGLDTQIIGVVSDQAPAAKLSFEERRIINTDSAHTFADGMAVRVVVQEAFEQYLAGAEKVLAVTDEQVADAIRLIYRTTHNVAEGAGAAAVAAALLEREANQGLRIGCILCGGNLDTDKLQLVLSGLTPEP